MGYDTANLDGSRSTSRAQSNKKDRRPDAILDAAVRLQGRVLTEELTYRIETLYGKDT